MANPERLEMLKQGVGRWNKWRDQRSKRGAEELGNEGWAG